MNISALLTSAGINTAVCLGLFSLYSVLRKQPSLVSVYFGQKLAQSNSRRQDPFWFGRLIPSASWIVKAWEASEDELYAIGGVDAVVFLRAVVFSMVQSKVLKISLVLAGVALFLMSIRVFTVAAIVCLFLVLPLNYFGKEMDHKQISDEQLIVFTIGNVKEGSRCIRQCLLKVMENVWHLALQIFLNWIGQMFLESDAEKMYKMLKSTHKEQYCGTRLMRCGFCGGTATSFKMLSDERASVRRESCSDGLDERKKECGAALVFFRTRYAALVASEALQSTNPMSWVTDSAPEPCDIFWSNLCVPYRLLWIRKIAVIVALVFFVTFFLFPVVFTQSLVHLDKLTKIFPFMKELAERKILEQLISGYLPSVVFIIFLYIVPPLMMLFSTLEGAISRSGRKRSTCVKVMYFVIWNVFFANILTEAAIDHYQVSITKLGDAKHIPNLLAKAVPATATFFMTYVLTSGWASLSVELIQPFPLLCNLFYRFILRNKDDSSYGTYTFPYHTEVPRVLLFGLLGFTCSILAPLILPFLLVYFVLAFLVYRNQILNVYVTEYESGGLYWPIVHNTTIFSLVLTQIIALGVFGLKESPIALAFTFPLIICTLLFHEYCRQRFNPVFRKIPAKVAIEMDRKDEQCGRVDDIHQKLQSAYCQFRSKSLNLHTTAEQNNTESVSVTVSVGTERGDASRCPPPLDVKAVAQNACAIN
ncbi:CSC1-like protein rxw8 [Phtheirospermum japonicum]|uniref:CSC1-like protein rxw8 n=1 Tax=Phtheirospermum japonicum TaxID=374723 RepID=A0A830C3J4_9LAMI|nr:CSC1-like protein rxw8 [Phtheirospermum japonicum]